MSQTAVPVESSPGARDPLPRYVPVAVAVLVAALLTAQAMLVMSGISFWMTDFLAYRGGGHAVLHNLRIYQVGVDTPAFADLHFIYTPFAAVVLAPVAALGLSASEAVWTFLSFLALAGGLWASLRMVGEFSRTRLTLLTAGGMIVASLLSPVEFNMLLGQINLFVMALVLVDFLPGRPERWRGIGIGIAAGLKLTPLLFVVYLLLTGRPRAALRAVAAFGATILLGWAVVPTDSRAYWLHGIFYRSSRMVPGNILVNHSLPGFFARLGHTTTPPGWTLVVSAVVGVLCLAAAVRAHRLGQDMLGMLVIAFAAQIVSPITWMHHGVWVVPALIWLGYATWRRGTVLARVVLGVSVVWYMVPVWVLGQRPSGDTAYQWTVPGNVLETLTGNLVPAVVALALLPVWLPRLRPPAGRLPAALPEPRQSRPEEALGT